MTLKVAIQMDPIADIDIDGDTSFALALEAQRRGHALFYYEPWQLNVLNGEVSAALAPLRVKHQRGAHFALDEARPRPLRDMDVVLMRQDPPFDMAYIAASHFLERVADDVLVVNNPVSVRNAPEKLLPLQFGAFMPPTLITRDRAAVTDFRAAHGDIILKPLFGNGGAGVFHVTRTDENFGALLDMFLTTSTEPFIAQAYLPAIRQGDKRLILVEGEAVGALNRVPRKGDARANVHVGARALPTELDARDYEIAAHIGPVLRAQGIILAGADIIGGLLTEINITSPTCICEIKALGGPDIAVLVWDAIEARCG